MGWKQCLEYLTTVCFGLLSGQQHWQASGYERESQIVNLHLQDLKCGQSPLKAPRWTWTLLSLWSAHNRTVSTTTLMPGWMGRRAESEQAGGHQGPLPSWFEIAFSCLRTAFQGWSAFKTSQEITENTRAKWSTENVSNSASPRNGSEHNIKHTGVQIANSKLKTEFLVQNINNVSTDGIC